MQFRRMSRFAVLALALALPACDSDDGVAPDIGGDLSGSWSLRSVGGQPLPMSQSYTDPDHGTCTSSLMEMVASFETGGVYTETNVRRNACPGQPAETDTVELGGTYSTTGNQLVVAYSDEPGNQLNFTYSVEGDRFTMRIGSLAYVFDREDGIE